MCDMGLPLGRFWGFVSALRSATAIITGTFCICLLSLLQLLCCCCYYVFVALSVCRFAGSANWKAVAIRNEFQWR